MKTKLITSLILFVSSILLADAQPQITWLKTDHDFATINEELGPVTCTYQYVNTGDSPLAITKARATCGCTSPTFDPAPLAPGDTATITVSFNPISRLGRFDKKVYVDTNTDPSRSTLTLHGTVIGSPATIAQRYPADFGPLKFRNGVIMIGDVTKGKLKTVFAEAYNPGPDTLRPHILTTPQYINAQPTPETVAPGEQISFILHLHSEKCPQWGLLEDSLTIIPDPQLAPTPITIPLTATILEDFSQLTNAQLKKAPQAVIQDDTLDFGQITANSPYTKTRTTTITNRGHSDLTIRRAYTLVPGVNISIDKQKLRAGQTTQLTVTINPSQLTAPILNDKITLITNSPENPQQTIRIIGLIQ